jgi:hypothetical protein
MKLVKIATITVLALGFQAAMAKETPNCLGGQQGELGKTKVVRTQEARATVLGNPKTAPGGNQPAPKTNR